MAIITSLPSCHVIAMAQGAPSLSNISELDQRGSLSRTKCLHLVKPDMRAVKRGSGFDLHILDPSETLAVHCGNSFHPY
jgi:hypothetical protein